MGLPTILPVEILKTNSPSKFEIRLLYDPKRRDSAAAFHKLKKEMDRYYSKPENDIVLKREDINKHSNFAAFSKQRGEWVRLARVCCFSEGNYGIQSSIQILCASHDYSFVRKIPLTTLRILPKKFLKVPQQSRCCSLYKLAPLELTRDQESSLFITKKVENWTFSAKNAFERMLDKEHTFFVHFIDVSDVNNQKVRLFFQQDSDNPEILEASEELVKAGYGIYEDDYEAEDYTEYIKNIILPVMNNSTSSDASKDESVIPKPKSVNKLLRKVARNEENENFITKTKRKDDQGLLYDLDYQIKEELDRISQKQRERSKAASSRNSNYTKVDVEDFLRKNQTNRPYFLPPAKSTIQLSKDKRNKEKRLSSGEKKDENKEDDVAKDVNNGINNGNANEETSKPKTEQAKADRIETEKTKSDQEEMEKSETDKGQGQIDKSETVKDETNKTKTEKDKKSPTKTIKVKAVKKKKNDKVATERNEIVRVIPKQRAAPIPNPTTFDFILKEKLKKYNYTCETTEEENKKHSSFVNTEKPKENSDNCHEILDDSAKIEISITSPDETSNSRSIAKGTESVKKPLAKIGSPPYLPNGHSTPIQADEKLFSFISDATLGESDSDITNDDRKCVLSDDESSDASLDNMVYGKKGRTFTAQKKLVNGIKNTNGPNYSDRYLLKTKTLPSIKTVSARNACQLNNETVVPIKLVPDRENKIGDKIVRKLKRDTVVTDRFESHINENNRVKVSKSVKEKLTSPQKVSSKENDSEQFNLKPKIRKSIEKSPSKKSKEEVQCESHMKKSFEDNSTNNSPSKKIDKPKYQSKTERISENGTTKNAGSFYTDENADRITEINILNWKKDKLAKNDNMKKTPKNGTQKSKFVRTRVKESKDNLLTKQPSSPKKDENNNTELKIETLPNYLNESFTVLGNKKYLINTSPIRMTPTSKSATKAKESIEKKSPKQTGDLDDPVNNELKRIKKIIVKKTKQKKIELENTEIDIKESVNNSSPKRIFQLTNPLKSLKPRKISSGLSIYNEDSSKITTEQTTEKCIYKKEQISENGTLQLSTRNCETKFKTKKIKQNQVSEEVTQPHEDHGSVVTERKRTNTNLLNSVNEMKTMIENLKKDTSSTSSLTNPKNKTESKKINNENLSSKDVNSSNVVTTDKEKEVSKKLKERKSVSKKSSSIIDDVDKGKKQKDDEIVENEEKRDIVASKSKIELNRECNTITNMAKKPGKIIRIKIKRKRTKSNSLINDENKNDEVDKEKMDTIQGESLKRENHIEVLEINKINQECEKKVADSHADNDNCNSIKDENATTNITESLVNNVQKDEHKLVEQADVTVNERRQKALFNAILEFLNNEKEKKLQKSTSALETKFAPDVQENSQKNCNGNGKSMEESLAENLTKICCYSLEKISEESKDHEKSTTKVLLDKSTDTTDLEETMSKLENDNTDLDFDSKLFEETLENEEPVVFREREVCLNLIENDCIKTLHTLERSPLKMPSSAAPSLFDDNVIIKFSNLNIKSRYRREKRSRRLSLKEHNKKIRNMLFGKGVIPYGRELAEPFVSASSSREIRLLAMLGRNGEISFSESVAWPLLLGSSSVFMVTPHRRSKDNIDMTFIIPIVRKLSEIKFKSSSPVFIVISQTWQCVESITSALRILTTENTLHAPKIVAACGNGISNDIDVLLLNGCDVLVCTASIFQLAIEKKSIRLDKTQFLCIHNAHLVLQLYKSSLEVFMKNWSFVLEKNESMIPQIALITDLLTEEVVCFFNTYMKTLKTHIFICNPTVAAVYAPLEYFFDCCDDEREIFTKIGKILLKVPNKRAVIYADSIKQADFLASVLNSKFSLQSKILNEGVIKSCLNEKNDSDTSEKIFVTIRGNSIPFYNAQILVFTYMPKQKEMYETLTLIYEALAKKIVKKITYDPEVSQTTDPSMYVFTREECMLQLPTVEKVMKAFNTEPPPKFLKWKSKHFPHSPETEKDGNELCHILLSYGKCYKFEKCGWRHKIVVQKDIPTPTMYQSNFHVSGKIRLIIVHLQNAISYYARILSYENEKGDVYSLHKEFYQLKVSLNNYFKEESNRIPLKTCCQEKTCTSACVQEGDLAALKLENETFVRVRVEEVQALQEEWKKGLIRVHLVDIGSYKEVHSSELLQLPPSLGIIPPQLMKVRLARVRPIDDFIQWPDNVTEFVTGEVLNKTMSAQVLIITCDTLVVDHLRVEVDLKTMGTTTPYDTIRRKLLDMNMAMSNPLHVTNLFRLFSKHIDTCSYGYTVHGEAVKLRQSSLKVGDVVRIVSAISPVNFFTRIVGSETKSLDDFLEKDDKDSLPIEVDWDAPTYVLAKWNNRWLRARVLERYDRTFKVLFIDNAECCEVFKSDIKCLKAKHLKKPFGAIHCILGNILCNRESKERVIEFLKITMNLKFEVTRLACNKRKSIYEVNLVNTDNKLKKFDLSCHLQANNFGTLDKRTFDSWFTVHLEQVHEKCHEKLRLFCGEVIYNTLNGAMEQFQLEDNLDNLITCSTIRCIKLSIDFFAKAVILSKRHDERIRLLDLFVNWITKYNGKRWKLFKEVNGLRYISHLNQLWPNLCKTTILNLSKYQGYNEVIFEDKQFFSTIRSIFRLDYMEEEGQYDFCKFFRTLMSHDNITSDSIKKVYHIGYIGTILDLLKVRVIEKKVRIYALKILHYIFQKFPDSIPFLASVSTSTLSELLLETSNSVIIPLVVRIFLLIEHSEFSKWSTEHKHRIIFKIHDEIDKISKEKDKAILETFMSIIKPPAMKKNVDNEEPKLLEKLPKVVKKEKPNSIVQNNRGKIFCRVNWSQSKHWLCVKLIIDDYEDGETNVTINGELLNIEIVCQNSIYKEEFELYREVKNAYFTCLKPRFLLLSVHKKLGLKWPQFLSKGKLEWIKGDLFSIMDSDNEYWSDEDENPILKKLPSIWRMSESIPMKIIKTQMDDLPDYSDTSQSDLSEIESVILD
ncbi:DgyrCDS13355 [Dimorphilus gyrociliatus]|uniref:RNA helicase n=1 Tax=Dimorphilus gyrociliatus TaxID=2664684 RepID=A0A7I8WAE1_9ANNE|nr:DgyrCDS13355 [Dimorphilus gyrociliatus]